jgi:hypothetical protein
MRNSRLAVFVVLLGTIALLRPAPVEASAVRGFCVKCVDGTGCGLEEALCAAWAGCSTGGATCGELGTCAGSQRLVVCNEGYESE